MAEIYLIIVGSLVPGALNNFRTYEALVNIVAFGMRVYVELRF